eukprot:TRINITY_DN9947_c0_g1_i1.p1 TRINITY_DN9947_c0_g1~~TRINITY_DN9947_c0_g1_i1.p1  ORF type:complete len:403 (+),score=45.23 TRINITY_DN9947_c0_g1_i1:149-1210(+)
MSVQKAIKFKSLVFSRDYKHFLAHKIQCWLLILMILAYLAVGLVSLQTMLRSYDKPEWETRTDPRPEGLLYPTVSVCAIEAAQSATGELIPYYPQQDACVFQRDFWDQYDSTKPAPERCTSQGQSRFGPVSLFGCIDYNLDHLFKATTPDSTLTIFVRPPQQASQLNGIGVTLRPPAGFVGPENWQTFEAGAWHLLQMNPFERHFLNGTKEVRYEMSSSSVPFMEANLRSSVGLNLRFSSLSVSKSKEIVVNDVIWFFATMGGLAGACSLLNKLFKWIRDVYCFDDRQYERLRLAHERDDDVLVAAVRKEIVGVMAEEKAPVLRMAATIGGKPGYGPGQEMQQGPPKDRVEAF